MPMTWFELPLYQNQRFDLIYLISVQSSYGSFNFRAAVMVY